MPHYRLAWRLLALIVLALAPGLARAESSGSGASAGVAIAIVDFAYVDTSGEPVDQTTVHRERLQAFMATLRQDVATEERFHLASLACEPPSCTDGGPAADDLLRVARDGGARILIIGGIHKRSTLIQTAKVGIVDLAMNRVILDRFYSFRGDGEEAWQRAAAFVSRDIRAALAVLPQQADSAAPVRLALFDVELEDVSAGAAATSEASSDAAQLASVTGEIRRLLAQSGRYHLIDVGDADAAAAKTHALRDCNGCDAGIALKLGADQSFVGVVRRISRTEYTVRFLIRDARTGAVVTEGDSGLRMGADYSWSRGATRLVKDRVLEGEAKK
jgi:uncharacterized tellurite resistance protein B-like protein